MAIWTDEPPTELGRYWVRLKDTSGNWFETIAELAGVDYWRIGDCVTTLAHIRRNGLPFGPRIPSAAELAIRPAPIARPDTSSNPIEAVVKRYALGEPTSDDLELLAASYVAYWLTANKARRGGQHMTPPPGEKRPDPPPPPPTKTVHY